MKTAAQVKSLVLADPPLFLTCLLLVPASLVAIMVFRLFDQNVVALGGLWLLSCSYFTSIAPVAAKKVCTEERLGGRVDIKLAMIILAAALWLVAAGVSVAGVLVIWPDLRDRAISLAAIALTTGVAIGGIHWAKANAESGPLS